MIAILIFSFCISLAYVVLIARFLSGWNSIPEFQTQEETFDVTVSLIVAFRNEEKNLPQLFGALQAQSYPSSYIEILLVDDHSDDRSALLAQQYSNSVSNARLIRMESHVTGKKKALWIAALEAKGKLLIFTDADALPGENWIKSIVSCYRQTKAVLIASPVVVKPAGDFFTGFQSLEFLSLIGSTAGSFGIHDPVMVNGANLTVDRIAYLENLDFLQNEIASGDDVFMLLNLKKKHPRKLVFLKSFEAIVSISPASGFSDFLQQRLRWASKSRYYKDRTLVLTSVIVLLINLWLLNCFVMSFFELPFVFIGGGVFLAKTIIDFIFMRKVLMFFRMERLMKYFVLSQFLYFLYISFTGLAGNFLPYKWKGRTVKQII